MSTSGLAFGNYDPTSGSAVAANGSISFTCTYTGLGFTATLSISPGNSGSYTNRTLTFGAQSLNYNIYVNAADTEIFGGGTGSGVGGTYYYYLCYAGGGVVCTGGGGQSGTQYVAPMYGLLPGGQDVSAGCVLGHDHRDTHLLACRETCAMRSGGCAARIPAARPVAARPRGAVRT